MKTISIPIALCIIALCIASCDKQNARMTTIIEEDGNCKREVSYVSVIPEEEQDSLERILSTAPKCLAVDSMMSVEWQTDADTVTCTFYQIYDNVEKMSAHTPLRINGIPTKTNAHLEKKFRWLYTEYTFTETFESIADKFEKSPYDTASADEVSYWFTGSPNLVEGMNGAEAYDRIHEIEPKMTRWVNDNLTSIVMKAIVNHYDDIVNPPMSKEKFINTNDSLTDFVIAQYGYDYLGEQDIKELFHMFFHSDAYTPLLNEEHPCYKEMEEKFSALTEIATFNVPYTLQMPGKVTYTGNGIMTTDGSILYPLTGERLIPKDYVITATSRVTNLWAWFISVLVIAIAVGSFIYGKKEIRTVLFHS